MFEVKEAKGHKLYEIWRDLSRPEAERTQALRDMESLYKGIMDRLPPEWKTVQDQAPAGNSAPRASTTDLNTSRATPSKIAEHLESLGQLCDSSMIESLERALIATDQSDPAICCSGVISKFHSAWNYQPGV